MKECFRYTVPVDRTKIGIEACGGLAHETRLNLQVVSAMPSGKREKEEICFSIPSKHTLSNAEAENDFVSQQLVPADPYALLAFNKLHPMFSDMYPHWTHWKNDNGIWCVMTFGIIELIKRKHEHTIIRREVHIGLNDYSWNHGGLLAGMEP